jgi:hypothetical protein
VAHGGVSLKFVMGVLVLRKFAFLFMASLIFVTISQPASASTNTDVSIVSGQSESCLAALAPNANKDDCSFQAILEMGPAQLVSTTIARSIGIYSASAVSYRDWTQTFVNLNYKEVHRGRFFYDGTYAWSTTAYRGFIGSHFCHQAGSHVTLGWVGNTQCTTERSVSNYSLVERETYDYAVLQDVPVGFTAAMSVLVNAAGGYVERPF